MKVNQCTRCGNVRGHFAVGWSAERTFEFRDNGLCMSCRHVKRPTAQMHGGDLKALLTEMNKRKEPDGRIPV